MAWSLLPLAAGLTGVLRLGWEIIDSVVSWGARLVFSPVVWVGLVVAGVSLVLFVVSGWMQRRGVGSRRAVASGRGDPTAGELPQRRSAPQASGTATGKTGGKAGGKTGSRAGGKTGDAEMDEIEEILRRRGIQ